MDEAGRRVHQIATRRIAQSQEDECPVLEEAPGRSSEVDDRDGGEHRPGDRRLQGLGSAGSLAAHRQSCLVQECELISNLRGR